MGLSVFGREANGCLSKPLNTYGKDSLISVPFRIGVPCGMRRFVGGVGVVTIVSDRHRY